MGNIFNNDKKKPKAQSSRITDLDRAVLGLKKQRDQLMKMQKQIEVGCETLHRDPRTSSGPGSLNFLKLKSGPVLIHSDITRE